MKKLIGALVLLSLSAGCGGDPRQDFVGFYAGSLERKVMTWQGWDTTNDSTALVLSAPEKSEAVTFSNTFCSFEASLQGDGSLKIHPTLCQTQRYKSGETECSFVDALLGGEGRRTEQGLELTAYGTGSLADCTNGAKASAPYTITINADRLEITSP